MGGLHCVESCIAEPHLSNRVESSSGGYGGCCRDYFRRRALQGRCRRLGESFTCFATLVFTVRRSVSWSCHGLGSASIHCTRQPHRRRGHRRPGRHGQSGQQAHRHHAERSGYQLLCHQLAEFFDPLRQHHLLPTTQRCQHLDQPRRHQHAITVVRHAGQQRQSGAGEPVRHRGGRRRGGGHRRLYGVEPAHERRRRAGWTLAVWRWSCVKRGRLGAGPDSGAQRRRGVAGQLRRYRKRCPDPGAQRQHDSGSGAAD